MAKMITTDLRKQTQAPKVEPTQNDNQVLKDKISSGRGTAGDNYAYNQATGDNQAARNLMLGNKELVESDQLNTKVSIDEAQTIKNAGVEKVGANIGLQKDSVQEAKKITGQDTPKAKVEAPMPIQTPENIQQWKGQGSDVGTLGDMIEGKYGTVATQTANGGIRATIGDKSYEWTIDGAGNPTKREVEAGYDSNALFTGIQGGQSFDSATKGSSEYKLAQNRMSKYNVFSQMSGSDLSNAMTKGGILPGTQAYNDLKVQNPELVREAEQLANLNSATQTPTTLEELQVSITKRLLATYTGDPDTYSQRVAENPEINRLNQDLSDKQIEMSELKDLLDNNMDDVTGKVKGKGVSKRYAQTVSTRESRNLARNYNLALNEYNTIAGNIERISEDIRDDMEANQVELQNASNALGLINNLTADDRALEQQRQQLELAHEYQNGDLNSENPTLQNIAIEKAVGEFYTNYPIPGMETASTKVARAKQLMAQGMTGSQAISQLENEIRSTQSYKDMVGSFQRGLQPEATAKVPNLEVLGQDSKGNDVKGYYDESTGQFQPLQLNFDEVSAGNMNWISLPDGADAGVQCGVFARKCSGLGSTPGGNSLTARIKAFKDQNVVAGGQVLFNGGGYDKTYGHVAFVESANDDGSFNVVESNLQGDNKVSRRTIAANDPNISGFYNDTPVANKNTPQISQPAQDWATNISSGSATIANVPSDLRTEVSSALANRDISLDDDNPIIQSLKGQFDIIDSIVDWEGDGTPLLGNDTKNESVIETMSGARQTGLTEAFTGTKGQMLSKIQFLLDEQPLHKLIEVKAQGATFGALSNAELALLTKSASLLNSAAKRNDERELTGFKLSEKDLKKHLRILRDGYSKSIEKKTGGSAQDDPLGIGDDNEPLDIGL